VYHVKKHFTRPRNWSGSLAKRKPWNWVIGVSNWDNIKIDLQEVLWGNGLNCFGLIYGQVAGSCEYGNELLVSTNAENFLRS
jgi:hypothetical protein